MVGSLCIAGYSCHSYSLGSKVHSIARDCPDRENPCVVGKSSQHQGTNIIMSQCPWTWRSKWEDLTLLSRPWIQTARTSTEKRLCVCAHNERRFSMCSGGSVVTVTCWIKRQGNKSTGSLYADLLYLHYPYSQG